MAYQLQPAALRDRATMARSSTVHLDMGRYYLLGGLLTRLHSGRDTSGKRWKYHRANSLKMSSRHGSRDGLSIEPVSVPVTLRT